MNDYEHHIISFITLLIAALNNAFWQDYMYFFAEPNAATALNDVMTSHLVLHVSNTRKYVMAVLTRIQGKLCGKYLYTRDKQNRSTFKTIQMVKNKHRF